MVTNKHHPNMTMNLIPTTTRNGHFLADFDHLFNRFFTAPERTCDDSCAAEEADKHWTLRVDVPGFRKEEVALSVENGELKLHAATKDGEDRTARAEVSRNWTLGEDVDLEGIDARLEHGVLEITLPKLESALPTNKTVEIR